MIERVTFTAATCWRSGRFQTLLRGFFRSLWHIVFSKASIKAIFSGIDYLGSLRTPLKTSTSPVIPPPNPFTHAQMEAHIYPTHLRSSDSTVNTNAYMMQRKNKMPRTTEDRQIKYTSFQTDWKINRTIAHATVLKSTWPWWMEGFYLNMWTLLKK